MMGPIPASCSMVSESQSRMVVARDARDHSERFSSPSSPSSSSSSSSGSSSSCSSARCPRGIISPEARRAMLQSQEQDHANDENARPCSNSMSIVPVTEYHQFPDWDRPSAVRSCGSLFEEHPASFQKLNDHSSSGTSNAGDGCQTPKSKSCRIPELLQCPPAPRKRRAIPKKNRYLPPTGGFFIIHDFDVFFPPLRA